MARHLSNYKSDPSNNPSLKSYMVRIPGSHNSKCVQTRIQDSEVKVIQKWYGRRINIRFFLGSFHAVGQNREGNNSTIYWIENLLQTPIPEYRKYVIWRVLASYLLNRRALSLEDSSIIMRKWLDNCNHLKRLDFDPNFRSLIRS